MVCHIIFVDLFLPITLFRRTISLIDNLNRDNTWVNANDDYNGDVDIERLDIVTDAKIDDVVKDARKTYFRKLGWQFVNLKICNHCNDK